MLNKYKGLSIHYHPKVSKMLAANMVIYAPAKPLIKADQILIANIDINRCPSVEHGPLSFVKQSLGPEMISLMVSAANITIKRSKSYVPLPFLFEPGV